VKNRQIAEDRIAVEPKSADKYVELLKCVVIWFPLDMVCY